MTEHTQQQDSPTKLATKLRGEPSALTSYQAVTQKADQFVSQVVVRRGARVIACSRGCEACCHVSLELNRIEAHVVYDALRKLPNESLQRAIERAQQQHRQPQQPRCVMLEQDGSCAIYEARPMVCRTQGMALRYPPHTFPEEAIMARDEMNSDIVWCPLNYRNAAPLAEDVLEAGRLDEMLALANRLYVSENRAAMLERYAMTELVLDMATSGIPAE